MGSVGPVTECLRECRACGTGRSLSSCTTLRPEQDGPQQGVAQPGSAPGLGPGGRRFKSYHPDQLDSGVEEW